MKLSFALFANRRDAGRQLGEKLLWLKDIAPELRKYHYISDDSSKEHFRLSTVVLLPMLYKIVHERYQKEGLART